MSKTPNKKLIGLFTFAGLAMFFSAMFIFLEDKLFIDEDQLVVLYFDESISGLTVGAPVVLQGVEVGKVIKIDLITDADSLTFKIPVFVKLTEAQSVVVGGNTVLVKNRERFFKALIKKGLRGRLLSQNLLTGQLMIELAFLPETEAVYKGNDKAIEIPTALSSFGELSKGLQDLPIRQSMEKFNKLMEESSSLVVGLNKAMNNRRGDAEVTIDNFNKTLKDISDAAQAMRNFADYIERHPEALLKGKGKY